MRALRRGGLRVRVVRCAHHRDEELALHALAALRIDVRWLLARVVDEAFLASLVHLSHDELVLVGPRVVVLQELRVAVPVGVLLQVLLVQQAQGHVRATQLQMQIRRIGQRPLTVLRDRRIQPKLELVVRQRVDIGPRREARSLRARSDLARHAVADRERRRDLAVAPLVMPLEAQDFFGLPHGQSLGRNWHSFAERPVAPSSSRRPADAPRRRACVRPLSAHAVLVRPPIAMRVFGDRDAAFSVIAIARFRRSPSRVFGDRHDACPAIRSARVARKPRRRSRRRCRLYSRAHDHSRSRHSVSYGAGRIATGTRSRSSATRT